MSATGDRKPKRRPATAARATATQCPKCLRKWALVDYQDAQPGVRCRHCGFRPETS